MLQGPIAYQRELLEFGERFSFTAAQAGLALELAALFGGSNHIRGLMWHVGLATFVAT